MTATEQVSVSKAKKVSEPVDLIQSIAESVETLTKSKALSRADQLAEHIEQDYLELGGVLKIIKDNSWFEGFQTFDDFVLERFGFAARKAAYLTDIYTHLVTKQIPWEKVKGLGWTKLKDLAVILTPDNVDEWVAKIENLSYKEMMALLKGAGADGTTSTNAKASDDVTVLKFKLKPDQLEVVQTALAKAKGETGTEYDTVALENICAGYVAGTIGGKVDVNTVLLDIGWEKTLEAFATAFPTVDLEVKSY